jgi:glycerol kinase
MILAIDQGTTGTTCIVFDENAESVGRAYREFAQHFPKPGWVEHDAAEIWEVTQAVAGDALADAEVRPGELVAVGIANQRETVCVWDPATGEPLHRAIVWQDRRTAARCEELRAAGHERLVRERTGLVLDPYFSGTKIEWLLGNVEGLRERARTGRAVFGTIDAWLTFKLTGEHATDPSNASRTMLYDIVAGRWDPELLALLDVPERALPRVEASAGTLGVSKPEALHGHEAPVAGVAGDQQAALFGQACFSAGMAKVTYGTGSFVLLNVGEACPPPSEGLLTTMAWDLGEHGGSSPVAYALEGAVFVTGAAVQWLRDGLGLIRESAEIEALARQVESSEGVYVVPAFTGLGSPWWDPYARGTITGITRGVGAAHIGRAVIEAMAFQVRDVVEAMSEVGGGVSALRVDGGASVMDLLLQMQADQIRIPVERPGTSETTALGAAWLAGLAEGVWGSTSELSEIWALERSFTAEASPVAADTAHSGWRRAVERSVGWASADQS